MSDELNDLRVIRRKRVNSVVGAITGTGWLDVEEILPVTAAEAASACPTEVLIAVLVERGVLEEQATGADWPFRLFAVRWPVAGGVS